MKRRPTLEQARAQYVHRFTMEHVPEWARKPMPNGRFYAPHFRTDAEWYANTVFPEETDNPRSRYCETSRLTWPLGRWLSAPYKRGAR